MVRRQDYQAVLENYHTDGAKIKIDFAKLCDQAKGVDTNRIRVSLNGTIFLVPFDICVKIPTVKTMLSFTKKESVPMKASLSDTALRKKSCLQKFGSQDDTPPEELYFERDPIVFAAVLDYVTNLELHVPRDVCPKVFARDLVFWGFSVDEVELCCFSNLASFLIQQEKVENFQGFLNKDNSQTFPGKSHCHDVCTLHVPVNRTTLTFKERVWAILDKPQDCLCSKIYFVVMCLFILLSYLTIALGTSKTFLIESDVSTEDHNTNGTGSNRTGTDTSSTHSTTIGTRNLVEEIDAEKRIFRISKYIEYLEYLCTGYLWLDYALRIICFPDLRQFLKDVINITDGVAVISTMAKYAVRLHASRPYSTWIQAIDFLQFLRILRFLRPMSKMTCFRLVYFTLQCSYRDLLLVCVLMLILSMIFSFFLYYLGNRSAIHSIPEAMWFCLITMTTVGYGDVVPKDLMGLLIGSVVAVFGVIIMTMTTPIMVTNFHALYINSIVGQPSTFKKYNAGLEAKISQLGPPSFVPSVVSLVPFSTVSTACSSHVLNKKIADLRDMHDTPSSWGWVSPDFKRFGVKDTLQKSMRLSRVSSTENPALDSERVPNTESPTNGSESTVAEKKGKETEQPSYNLTDAFPTLLPERNRSAPHLRYIRPRLNSILSLVSKNSSAFKAVDAACPKAPLTGSVKIATKSNASRKGSTKQRQENVCDVTDVKDSGAGRADIDHTKEKKPATRKSIASKTNGKRESSPPSRGKRGSSKGSPTSTKDIKLKQKGGSNFNENMTLHDTLFNTPGHRTKYVNYESSDTDIESDWSQGEGCVHALDFIPPLEKTTAQTVWRRKRRQMMTRKRSAR